MGARTAEISVQRDLKILREARAYREWVFALVEPWLGQRILEIGSGIGNYTEKMVRRERVCAGDCDPAFVAELRDRFKSEPAVRTLLLDLAAPDGAAMEALSGERIDTVLILNVLEHVEDDAGSLLRMKTVLESGGRLVVVVPALPCLYGSLDASYGHFRRYSRRDFVRMAAALDMGLRHFRYFNLAGIAGWWLNVKIQRRRDFSPGQVRLFDRMVPLFRFAERLIAPPVGLSLLAVLEKRPGGN